MTLKAKGVNKPLERMFKETVGTDQNKFMKALHDCYNHSDSESMMALLSAWFSNVNEGKDGTAVNQMAFNQYTGFQSRTSSLTNMKMEGAE